MLFLYAFSGSIIRPVPKKEDAMRADRVEVTWDSSKSRWLARIQSGEEVIRRYCNLPAGVDDVTLRTAIMTLASDEGYEAAPDAIQIIRANQAGSP
jgi:hypothetical protein